MVCKYKVITLCGSTKFKEQYLKAQKRLTLEGNIVISVGLFGHSGDDEVWTGDFRYTPDGWSHHSFCGDKWQNINKPERKAFQKNAYLVLLTRARQGMVLVVPEGTPEDPTRNPEYYDSTYEYLKEIGIQII